MVRASVFVVLLASGFLTACGGGAAGLPPTGAAVVDGGVTQVDGVTAGLGGIEFMLVETGQKVVTRADGTFELTGAPVGSFTLALVGTGGAGVVDGAQAFAANCSVCHGADGSGPPNARGKTDAQYAAALSRSPMSSISLTPEEYDAIFAFLSDAPAPPAPPPAPPTPPTDESDGAMLYRASCAACHGDFDTPANAAGGNRQVLGARACTIEGSLTGTAVFPGGVPAMAGLQGLTAAQVEAIAGYLDSQPVTGQQRYVANCAGCHGMSGEGGRVHEDVRGESAGETREAVLEVGAMRYLACLPTDDIDQIGAWLAGSAGGDDDEGDDDHEHPDGHEADDDEPGSESSEHDVSVHGVSSGEHIRVRVRIADGRIERCDVSRSGHDEREVEVFLQRTDANDDADMTGRLELQAGSSGARIEVKVEHATPARDLELVFVDPEGNDGSVGIRTVDALGRAAWELDTNAGATLPFGVASLADLEGYGVEVRDVGSGSTLLRAQAPELPAATAGGEGYDGSRETTRLRGRARLLADEAGLEGHVEVSSRLDEGRERLQVEAEHLAPGRTVEFLIEDAGQPGTYVSLGTRAADAEGEAELRLDTGEGASLPGGAAGVAELQGLGVEVRDATSGLLLLHGTVPSLHAE